MYAIRHFRHYDGNQTAVMVQYTKNAFNWHIIKGKVKFSYTRYRALGPELIPVCRQSAHEWLKATHPAVGCHYFPPGLRLPSQLKSVTSHRPVPNYTASWQRHMRVSSLPKAVTWNGAGRDSNPRPLWSRANALPLSHTRHHDIYRSVPPVDISVFIIYSLVNRTSVWKI